MYLLLKGARRYWRRLKETKQKLRLFKRLLAVQISQLAKLNLTSSLKKLYCRELRGPGQRVTTMEIRILYCIYWIDCKVTSWNMRWDLHDDTRKVIVWTQQLHKGNSVSRHPLSKTTRRYLLLMHTQNIDYSNKKSNNNVNIKIIWITHISYLSIYNTLYEY